MVFFEHYYSLPWGWTGVNIFFVLSGFLITGILFDSRDDLHRARNFYIRRTLRIFPLYYGIFFALLLLDPFVHWHWTIAWIAWPLYLANFLRFISPTSMLWKSPLQLAANAWLSCARHPNTYLYFGHFWSLSVEEQFYLIWPWLVFWLRSRRALLWICGMTVVLTPLLRVAVQHTAPAWMLRGELLHNATPFQLDSLLLGGLIALLWRGTQQDLLLTFGRIIGLLAAIATITYLAFTVHLSALPNWHAGYRYPTWLFTWGLTFVNVFTAALILCCLRPQGALARVLSLRPLRWLGRISYGAYVFHDIFHNIYSGIVTKLGHHVPFIGQNVDGLTALFGLICTLIISWLSFRFFESPFLNLKERWTIRPAR